MSGNRSVQLVADADGAIARLIHAAELFGTRTSSPWALVGGMAVVIQLAGAHRATADVDAVADDDAGSLEPELSVLAHDQQGTSTGSRVILGDGTKIDVITTGSWVPDDLPDDDLDRVFILGHWWAVQSASAVTVQVVDGAAVAATADINVASPAALVACKLQSCRRRQRDPAKVASDIYDIYRLLVEHDADGGVATALANGPEDLGPWCAEALVETFATDADRSARKVGISARGPAMADVRALDLSVVGGLCAEAIRELL